MRSPCFTLLILLALLNNSLFGAVQWETKHIQLTADPNDSSLVFRFPFSVINSKITFVSTEIPCGCAEARPNTESYEPGESGIFTVRLSIDDRLGKQQFDIEAKTTDQQHPVDTLEIVAVIPELLHYSKKVVVWDNSNQAFTQHLTVTVAPGYKVTSVVATSSHSSVKVTVTKTEDPSVYQIETILLDKEYKKPVKITIDTDLSVKRQATSILWAINRLP